MASTLLELILKARDDASRVMKGLQSNVKGLFGGFTELSSALTLTEKGLGAVEKVIDETVNKTSEHIRSSYELSLAMGTTVEEASRLAEVADDNRISIEQLSTAMALARKNGFEPSIENIAQLADQVNNLNDKNKQAKLLNDTFGRGWKTLLPLLKQGGDAIRAQASAIDENLIVTEEMVRQEEAYHLAVDNATDAIDAQKYAIGNSLLPILTQMLTPATTEVVNGQAFLVKQIGDTTQAWIRQGNVLVEATTQYNNAKAAIEGVDKAAKMEIATEPIEELGEAAEGAAGQLDNIIVKLGDVGKASLAQKALDAVNQEFQKTGDMDAYRENIAKVGTLFSDVIPAGQLEANLALVNLERAYANGDLALDPYLTNLANFDQLLRGLPKFVDIYIRTHYSSTGTPPNTGGGGSGHDYGGGLQHGGTVEPGGMYEVTEGGKSELLSTPSGNYLLAGEKGEVIPIEKSGGGKATTGGGLYIGTIIINAPQNADAEAIANLAVRKIFRAFQGSAQLYHAG